MASTRILVYFLVAIIASSCNAEILQESTNSQDESTEKLVQPSESPPAEEIEAVPIIEQIEEVETPDGKKETLEIVQLNDIQSLASFLEEQNQETNSEGKNSENDRQIRGLSSVNLRYTTPFRAPVKSLSERKPRHPHFGGGQNSYYSNNRWSNRWDSNYGYNNNYNNYNNNYPSYGYPSRYQYNRYPGYSSYPYYNRYSTYGLRPVSPPVIYASIG